MNRGGGSKSAPLLEKCYLGPNKAISIIKLILANQLHGTMISYTMHYTNCRIPSRKKLPTQLTNYTMIYMLCRSMTYFFKRSYLLYVAISIINYQWSFKATSGDLTKCINMEHEVVVIVL